MGKQVLSPPQIIFCHCSDDLNNFLHRLALGVVQGYDPDYDMVLNSSSDDCQFTTLHVLLCVDTANANASKEPSGWVDPDNMPLCQGTILQLSVIG